MMQITRINKDNMIILKLNGRLDTTTAPQLENEIKEVIDDADKLVIDMEQTEYVSSAGLRVFLGTHKKYEKKGGLIIRNINETVREIFEMTGFLDVFNVE